jgi:hypothetical protein
MISQEKNKFFQSLLISLSLFLSASTPIVIPFFVSLEGALAQSNQDINNINSGSKILEEIDKISNDPEQIFTVITKFEEALSLFEKTEDQESLAQTQKAFSIFLEDNKLLAQTKKTSIERDLQEFVSKNSVTEDSQTTEELKTILAKELGFLFFGTEADQQKYIVTESESSKFEETITPILDEYLNSQVNRLTNDLDPLPAELTTYLKEKNQTLNKISDLLLNNNTPLIFQVDLTYIETGDPSVPLPSFIAPVNLTKLFLISAIHEYEQRDYQAMTRYLNTLVSFNQSLQNHPTLIGQLVNLIIQNYQAGILRKLDFFTPEWKGISLDHDYLKSVLISLKGETLFTFQLLNNPNLLTSDDWIDDEFLNNNERDGEELSEEELMEIVIATILISFFDNTNSFSLENFSLETLQDYTLWKSIQQYESYNQVYDTLDKVKVCDRQEILKILNVNPESSLITWINQWFKANRLMLELEFSQKVLNVKTLIRNSEEFPESIASESSQICPNLQWDYPILRDKSILILTESIKYQDFRSNHAPFVYQIQNFVN